MNNNKTIPRNTRKHFFTFILVISAAVVILLVIIFSVKKVNSKNKQVNKENNSTTNELSEPNPISLKDIENCPYLNEANLTTDGSKRKYGQLTIYKNDLPQWRQIPTDFIVSSWKKGYHWSDILQLWEWKISEAEIPDLKAQQRIGVINSLSWFGSLPSHILEDETISKEEKIRILKEDRFGFAKDLVVIVRKTTHGGKTNLDKGINGASPYGNTQKYVLKLVNFILNQENLNPNQYEIFLLNCIGAERLDEIAVCSTTGKSFGSAIYLALLSALHQKPIAKSVAATGRINTSRKNKKGKINDQEINLVPGDNLPISGLKGKSYAAVEKGISHLVLSSYNTAPNLLGQNHKTDYYTADNKHITEEWGLAKDYSKVVPPEIREKLTVFWTKNISELRELILGGKLS